MHKGRNIDKSVKQVIKVYLNKVNIHVGSVQCKFRVFTDFTKLRRGNNFFI